MRSPYWARVSFPLIVAAIVPILVVAALVGEHAIVLDATDWSILGGGFALAIGASVFTWRQAVSALATMNDTVEAINVGDAQARLAAARRLGALTGNRSAGLEKIANESLATERIRNAIDSTGSFLMVADEDMKIVYVNRGLSEMFRRAEADIRKALPEFRAEGLVGRSMDVFHRNAEVQRRHIERLTGTHEATIELNGWQFALSVSPVLGKDGQRTGTVVEWRDVTDEVRVQRDLDAVIAAANQGDFSRRVDGSGAQPTLAGIAAKLNTLLQTIDGGLGETIRVAKALADGDLTQRHTGDFEGQFATLQECVNTTAVTLGGLIARIRGSSLSIEQTSGGLSRGAQDLSERAESQAASLEQTAATMEEMAATIKANADGAVRATQLATRATDFADESGAICADAVAAIGRIEESAAKIRAIVDVIDGIAFQTNLLALNAAVEAARAGEAGKGFAVVASEVRQLAQRSADAARDVNSLISESGENVASGVKAVHATGQSLEQIQETIRDIAATISDISTASQEQANAVQEVTATVNQLDQFTQSNASAASESAGSAGQLLSQASDLSEVVRAFRVDESRALHEAA